MNEPTTLGPRLAAELGETDPGRRDRLDRLVRTLGEARALALLARAEALLAGGDQHPPTALGATPLAGVFFRLVHEETSPAERARIFAAEAKPAVRARVPLVPGTGDPAPDWRPFVILTAHRGSRWRIGCLVLVLAFGLLEHAFVGLLIYLRSMDFGNFAGADLPSPALWPPSPHYAPATWTVWWGTIAAIVGCAVVGARRRSEWWWVFWWGVLLLLLPIAWLALVDVAFKS